MIRFLFTFFVGSSLLDTISVNAKNHIDAIGQAISILTNRYKDFTWLLDNVTYNVKRIEINQDKLPTVYNLKNNLSSFGSNYPMIHPKLFTYVLCDNLDHYPSAKKSPLHRIKSDYRKLSALDCTNRLQVQSRIPNRDIKISNEDKKIYYPNME